MLCHYRFILSRTCTIMVCVVILGGGYASLEAREVWALGPGALGRPGGSGWRGRWEGDRDGEDM